MVTTGGQIVSTSYKVVETSPCLNLRRYMSPKNAQQQLLQNGIGAPSQIQKTTFGKPKHSISIYVEAELLQAIKQFPKGP